MICTTLHRLVKDLFTLLQGRYTSEASGPDALKILLRSITDIIDCSPRGAALKTLQTFDLRTGTPLQSFPSLLEVPWESMWFTGG